MSYQKVIKNAGYCKVCDEEIESVSRHDFKSCTCGNIFVDGGHHYTRHGVEQAGQYENRSVYSTETPEEAESVLDSVERACDEAFGRA